ncbi:MAG: N-formylglutamate amidohydrolase [Boseongicola sp.]|nr:N-formylglutamate amidohydrolase [Boseongicola sp.]
MSDAEVQATIKPVEVVNVAGSSSIVLVCEHASKHFPVTLNKLGLAPDALESHAAWDPGAMGVARRLSEVLDAALVAGTVSRLVYDCNRPPEAADAILTKSEVFDVPGNIGLSETEQRARVEAFYVPFKTTLADRIACTQAPVVVTVHSFTPVYHGKTRSVEIGILHDRDSRLADAMLDIASDNTGLTVRRNDPYGPADGVTHTLKQHALPGGYLNVMLEVRNDLIKTAAEQRHMADMIGLWLVNACLNCEAEGVIRWSA